MSDELDLGDYQRALAPDSHHSANCLVDGPGGAFITDGAGDGSDELSGEKSSFLSAPILHF